MVRYTEIKNKGYTEKNLSISKKTPEKINVNCPRCNSKNIEINRRGFSYGGSAAGGVLLGPLGLLVGGAGKDNLKGECLNCGKKFDVSKALKKSWLKTRWVCEDCNEYFFLEGKELKELEEKGKVKVKCPYCNKIISCEE